MMDYQGNSNKLRSGNDIPEKKIEKVITGEVVQKKKSAGRRFKDIFFGGDFNSAIRYVAADVLLPALRNMMVDTAQKTVERIVFGENARGRGRMPEYRSHVQYNNPFRPPQQSMLYSSVQNSMRYSRPEQRSQRETNQFVLVSRSEAELVVERMSDILDKYEAVSVSDLNELLGLPTSPIDNKWGWLSLNGVEVRQTRDGYLIDLPSADPL